MARIKITVVTTLHGEVTIDQHFDETVVSDRRLDEATERHQTTCVADAVMRAGAAVAAAHGETLR